MSASSSALGLPPLADALRQGRPDADQRRALGRLAQLMLWPLLAMGALLAGWVATAPLAGAVVAPAAAKVELNRKTVQHQEGGIVREILVRDGQRVKAGEPLLVIADLRSQAELAQLHDQLLAARVREARAAAEALFAPRFELPPELAAEAGSGAHVLRERAVFAARRQALVEQGDLMAGQSRDAREQASALETQIEATGQSIRISDEELAINDRLASEGFVHRTRLLGLQRVAADYRTRLGEHRSELAAVRQRGGELAARAAQLRLQYQAQAADEQRDAAALVRQLEERLRPSRDQVERQTLRAPVDGEVMGLRIGAAGAVVAPREALLDIVPSREKLVFEARIAPQDIEHLRVGGAAEIKLLGSEARDLAPLPARITFVSADRVTDPQQGRAWFDVTVEVDTATLATSARPVKLQPGMSAELYVTTGERTLVEYLLQPLGLFAGRALREP